MHTTSKAQDRGQPRPELHRLVRPSAGPALYQMQVHGDDDLAMELTTPEGRVNWGILDAADEDDLVSRGQDFNEFIVNYQEVYYDYNEQTGQVDTTWADPPIPGRTTTSSPSSQCAMCGH